MRSPLWFVVAAVIGVGGLVAGFVHMFAGAGMLQGLMRQVVMPGSVTVDLPELGIYTIRYQTRSGVDGRNTSSSGLRLSVFAPDGTELNLKADPVSTFGFGGLDGISFYTFGVATPGQYRITGTLPNGRTEPKIVLLVTGAPIRLYKNLFQSMAMIGGGLAVGGLIAVLTIIGRGKARRAAAVN